MISFLPKILERSAKGVKIRKKTIVKVTFCTICPIMYVVLVKNNCAVDVNFVDTKLKKEIIKAIHKAKTNPFNKKSKISIETITTIDSFGFLLFVSIR